MTRHAYLKKLNHLTTLLLDLLNDTKQMIEFLHVSITEPVSILEQAKFLDSMVRKKTMVLLDLAIEILTLQQPFASDVRLILASIRIKNDIERIVREILHVIEFQLSRAHVQEEILVISQFHHVFQTILKMLNTIMQALVADNPNTLPSLTEYDGIIDQYYESSNKELRSKIQSCPKNINHLLDLLYTTRMVERIGDHLCNIAEKVYYFKTGKNIRIA